ncbi:hypothetical protein Poli38472_003279 [Pythium oligandrum]|uniref:GYF domain-containing protein n=1 Tax=Pythium oligandrum TaxID=41045 RepID=A0A8K1C681_PYTOL|nr:hypothetical protein Poli38472_003279 [Pythium oligandrum]|eukprot:TMW57354.1 hypothetical protein Poli38472_003279 [Pythium oligandrum]
MKREEQTTDDDFVTKTHKSRKKTTTRTSSTDESDVVTTSETSAATTASDGMSLRPRTMFAVKGRGRTEGEASSTYRPQWSKDGEGFVSNMDAGERDGRRKGKVIRYSKEELLALHVTTTSPPTFPPDTAVGSELALPPVSTIPFDYEEVYKQWALNRNRGRGRGRTASGSQNANVGNNDEGGNKWDRSKRGNDRQRGDGDDRWERGGGATGDDDRDDIWDDVGLTGGETGDFDLSSMAAAAEKFRREMDAMREEERKKTAGAESAVTDMDAFDKKLEDAVAAGQFEDSDEEEVQWDDPTDLGDLKNDDDSLLFQATFNQSPEPKPLALEEPSFSLASLSDNTFGLAPLTLEVEVVDEWYYLDPQGMQQGPFKTMEMREWFEAGYFKPHLPIRFGREGTFTPLANHFLQGQMPFAAPPRPTPKTSVIEQQRLMEMHQRQQHEMMRLQQQQEQQRMLQFNQEEKIRLEMQRLEIARQQQNHLFQQQQQMIHQQQQQQQQHMLLQQQQQQQQQSSWQRSQREGIMSALGIFGGGGNDAGLGANDSFRSEASFQSDFRAQPQFDLRGGAPHVQQDQLFRNENPAPIHDPWGSNGNQRTFGDITNQAEYFGGAEHQGAIPRNPESSMSPQNNVDPWGKPSNPLQELLSSQEVHVEKAVASPQKAPAQPTKDESPVSSKLSPSPKKEKSKVSPIKKNVRANEAAKRDVAWSNATTVNAPNAASLKKIQEEEQRQLRKQLEEEQKDSVDLASMGAQLKMMLGVSANAPAPPTPPAPTQAPAPPAPVSAPTPTPPRGPPAPPAAPAWGAAATAAKPLQSSKSLREILAEEERLAAERAKRAEAAPTSSHWMNVVAGNSVAAPAVPKASRLGPVPASVLKSTTRQSRASITGDATAAQKKPVTTPSKAESDASFWNFGAAQAAKGTPAQSTSPNNFGGSSVSSDFMSWCAKQLKSINGSDDLTLVEYCATLEDPGEIREYLAAYLGSTPKVSAFATEFIQRKKSAPGAKKGSVSTEAGTVSGDSSDKKGKRRTKGQKIDPSLLNYSVGS